MGKREISPQLCCGDEWRVEFEAAVAASLSKKTARCRPAPVLHSVLGDSDYTKACVCFPCHNKTLIAKLGLGGLFYWKAGDFPEALLSASACAWTHADRSTCTSYILLTWVWMCEVYA